MDSVAGNWGDYERGEKYKQNNKIYGRKKKTFTRARGFKIDTKIDYH